MFFVNENEISIFHGHHNIAVFTNKCALNFFAVPKLPEKFQVFFTVIEQQLDISALLSY